MHSEAFSISRTLFFNSAELKLIDVPHAAIQTGDSVRELTLN